MKNERTSHASDYFMGEPVVMTQHTELRCNNCGTDKECMGGRSAHLSNWYCPKCPSPATTSTGNVEVIATPRTDAEAEEQFPNSSAFVEAGFARQLERELAALQAKLAESETAGSMWHDHYQSLLNERDTLRTQLAQAQNEAKVDNVRSI